MYLSSAKSYNLCRQFFPIPSFQMIPLKMKKNLIDLDSIDKVSKDYIHENRLDSEDEESDHISRIINLAIDAFTFKSFTTTALTNSKNVKVSKDGKSIIFNNGFLYMMIPIDFRLPPKVLYFEKWCNGFYNDFIEYKKCFDKKWI